MKEINYQTSSNKDHKSNKSVSFKNIDIKNTPVKKIQRLNTIQYSNPKSKSYISNFTDNNRLKLHDEYINTEIEYQIKFLKLDKNQINRIYQYLPKQIPKMDRYYLATYCLFPYECPNQFKQYIYEYRNIIESLKQLNQKYSNKVHYNACQILGIVLTLTTVWILVLTYYLGYQIVVFKMILFVLLIIGFILSSIGYYYNSIMIDNFQNINDLLKRYQMFKFYFIEYVPDGMKYKLTWSELTPEKAKEYESFINFGISNLYKEKLNYFFSMQYLVLVADEQV